MEETGIDAMRRSRWKTRPARCRNQSIKEPDELKQ